MNELITDLKSIELETLANLKMSKANNTIRAYKSDFKDFSMFCAKNGFSSLPTEPKIISLSPPICNDTLCHCHAMNFFDMIKVLYQRRFNLIRNLKCKSTKNMNRNLIQQHSKKLLNLDIKPSNYLFVGENGSIWRPSKLTEIVKDLIHFVNMPNPQNYASYSEFT